MEPHFFQPPLSSQPSKIKASLLEGKIIENLTFLKGLIRGEKARLTHFEDDSNATKRKENPQITQLKKKIIDQFLYFDMTKLAALSIPKKLQEECFELLMQAWRQKTAKEFSKTMTLTHLKFSKESFKALIIALSLNVELHALRLDSCFLRAQEASAISLLIKVHPSLSILHLNHNPLKDEGFKILSEALLQNDTLTHLSFNEIELSDESIDELEEVIKWGNYKSVSLKQNLLSDENQELLIDKAHQKEMEIYFE